MRTSERNRARARVRLQLGFQFSVFQIYSICENENSVCCENCIIILVFRWRRHRRRRLRCRSLEMKYCVHRLLNFIVADFSHEKFVRKFLSAFGWNFIACNGEQKSTNLFWHISDMRTASHRENGQNRGEREGLTWHILQNIPDIAAFWANDELCRQSPPKMHLMVRWLISIQEHQNVCLWSG